MKAISILIACLLIIICCSGCEKYLLVEGGYKICGQYFNPETHQHVYTVTMCGDGLRRIGCCNYPCDEPYLYYPKYRRNIIVTEDPEEPWEVSYKQAEKLCSNPEEYFVRTTKYRITEGLFFKRKRVDWRGLTINEEALTTSYGEAQLSPPRGEQVFIFTGGRYFLTEEDALR